jgi:S-DNA-T family DNA segregation ATPase FtsK/SpoIIIE
VALSTAGRYSGSFVSDEFRAAIARRCRELVGLVLLGAVGAAAAALATWSVNDPSFSHATNAPVRNVLGAEGAIAADLAMQLFGLAAIAIILPPGLWGWRLFSDRALDRLGPRIAAWIVGLVLAAGFASCLPRTAHWPLPSGIGGVIGDAVLRVIASLAGAPLHGMGHTVAEASFGALGFVAIVIAAGFGFHRSDKASATRRIGAAEDEADDGANGDGDRDRASVSIGWLVHGLLSLRARAFRLVAALGATCAAIFRRRTRPWRTEPTMEPREKPDDPFAPADPEDEIDSAPTKTRAPRKPVRSRAARGSGDRYEPPSLSLLAAPRASDRAAPSMQAIRENGAALENVLADFGVRGEIINARPGPVVTLYELEPAPGIKSSRVIGLADDIARSMSALSARVAVVSGRNVIGIELPNQTREKVYLRELLMADEYAASGAKLALCLGKTIGGEPVIVDLARMPHLLIAGTTGSGKSVAINTMILSLLYRLQPEECRLIMVDPKMLELSVYDGIPHLLAPVVTDPKKAVVALKWAVREMEDRYRKMAKLGVRNIDGYNARLAEARARGEVLSRTVQTGYDRDSGDAIYETEEFDQEPLPFLVVIVDEMADLMMVAGKDIEGAIQRLAQMARAAGIHVVLATQRPSVDVITGTIKANFPTRISFQVTSKIDSRTILGEQGAEQLLGQGDMLYMAGGGRISRVHGPFVSDEEVEKIVRHLKAQGRPQYLDAVTEEDDGEGEGGAVFDATAMGAGEAEAADLYAQAVQVVTRDRKASTSYIQRRLQIGYNRAASLIERMEQEGIVGQPNHSGKREILVGGEEDERY